jgi:putative endonuclease
MSDSRPLDGFTSEPHTRARGQVGEQAAHRWLEERGYRIVACNVRNDSGEIDVVAWDGETLCFIEVKARSSPDFGPAIEAVTPRKQRRLARAAAHYLVAADGPPPACRFDVLGLDLEAGEWRYTLVRDAFEADGLDW